MFKKQGLLNMSTALYLFGKILGVDVSTPTQTLPTIEPNVLKFVLYDSITANKFILLLADAFNLNKHCE